MDWHKGIIRVRSEEEMEIVAAVLLNRGITGIEIVNDKERIQELQGMTGAWDYADECLLFDEGRFFVAFYVPWEDGSDEVLAEIVEDMSALGLTVEFGSENEGSWVNEWKKHFHPIKIENIVVVPEWVDYEKKENEVVFKIDPGAAFGTGQHESTRLCIEAIDACLVQGDSVLDIGCGSGILSCISSLLGASRVLACDIDGVGAVNTTKKNIALNNLDNIEVFAGNALTDLDEKLKFDLIIANIVADVIVSLSPLVSRLANANARFISSGIIVEKSYEVRQSFKDCGYTIVWEKELNGWLAFVVEVNA